MPSSPPTDPLRRLLASWRLQPPPDANFRTSVWSRIDQARRPATWTRFARAHPAAVGALLVAAITVGAISGRVEARDRSEARREAIAANYVHGLDARWLRQQ